MSKQNIKVSVRIRPLSTPDNSPSSISCQQSTVTLRNQHRYKTFRFNRVHDNTATQQQIFQSNALPLIEDMLKGHACALFAYGQNASGKSHTICGDQSQESKGVIPRMVDHLAQALPCLSHTTSKTLIRVSYIEINNEEVADLLSIRRNARPQVIEKKREVELKDVEMKSVRSVEDLETQFILGNRKRSLAYSKKYRKKQNSTSIFTVRVERWEEVEGKKVVRCGRMDVVQLAASEIGSKFDLGLGKESPRAYSLSEQSVKNVINSIVYGDSGAPVPYEDSKVTKILRHTLGGDCKTTIIFHVSPLQRFYSGSLATLRLAVTAGMVENTPSLTINPLKSLIEEQLSQLQLLRHEQLRVRQEIAHFQQQAEAEKESEEGMGDVSDSNEFISQSVIKQRIRERHEEQVDRLKVELADISRKIDDIEGTFLKLPSKDSQQSEQARQHYESALSKLNTPQQRDSEGPLGQKQRVSRQQQYDMQRQFQTERQELLSALRDAQEKYRFYYEVANKAVRKEEMDLLRLSAVYDSTTRSYQLPNFAIRQSTFRSPGSAASSRIGKSMSNSISERKFMMTQLSGGQQKKVSEHVSQKKGYIQLKRMTSEPRLNEAYSSHFHCSPLKPLPKKKDYMPIMGHNEYELVQGKARERRLLRKKETEPAPVRGFNRGSTSQRVKTIVSPVGRFKFK